MDFYDAESLNLCSLMSKYEIGVQEYIHKDEYKTGIQDQ
jgi:hypothetical protein